MKNIKVVGFVVALVIVGFAVAKNYMDRKDIVVEDGASSIQTALAQDWQTRKVGETGLTVFTPDGLKNVPVKLDKAARKLLESYDAYEYAVTSFSIRIIHTVAIDGLDHKDYADKLANMVKDVMKVDTYTYSIDPYEKGDMSGSALTGVANKNGFNTVINSVIVAKDKALWEVTVSYDERSKKLAELTEKILSSVEVQ